MKVALYIVGGLLFFIGAVWTLQGLNILAGSAMSGQSLWLVIGSVLIVVGVVLEIVAVRLKKR